jgi:GMP synthase (glutamine-hydrolysing)
MDEYPFLRDEVALVSQAVAEHKVILGICLGSQIIAEALGAETKRSPEREVGQFPVELTDDGRLDPVFKGFPNRFSAFHWHNDMPGIPSGAVLLAKSEGCPHQAFRYGDRTYGLQFHLETTGQSAKELIRKCPGDLNEGKYTQSREEILSADFGPMNTKMEAILNFLVERISPRIGGSDASRTSRFGRRDEFDLLHS